MPATQTAPIEKLNGVSSDAVRKATGSGWDEWLSVLDAAGAQQLSHPEIVQLLSGYEDVSDWWRQMITVGYEQARGLRAIHEKADGFTANASKTLSVPVSTLFTAWADATQRQQWLPDAPMAISKATPDKSIRSRWAGESSLDVNFYARGPAKSQVTLQHARLANAETAAEMKAYWAEALKRLTEHLA